MKIPKHWCRAERAVAEHVELGILAVDDTGAVWRTGWQRTKRGGDGLVTVQVEPRRAENDSGSYLMVRATVGGRRVHCLAHRLVWHVLRGPIPEGMVVNHINGTKRDNRPENLEVVTLSENIRHAHRLGLADQKGERNNASVLTDAQVVAIRAAVDSGEPMVRVAEAFGAAFQTVSKIVRGDRRKDAGGPTSRRDHRNCDALARGSDGRFHARDGERQVRQWPAVLMDRRANRAEVQP